MNTDYQTLRMLRNNASTVAKIEEFHLKESFKVYLANEEYRFINRDELNLLCDLIQHAGHKTTIKYLNGHVANIK